MVFSRGGLVVNDICRVNLFGLGEELYWLSKLLKIECGDLVHLLELVDVSLEFYHAGQSHGNFFARLDII